MEQEWRDLLDWFTGPASGVDQARALVAVAWSGGVDSSLVALAARRALGDRALALTADTVLIPAWERDGLADAARELGLAWRTVPVDLLVLPGVARNGPDRCYHCKRAIMEILLTRAGLLADGTNADDDPLRPGRRALAELGVRSPLAELGLTKARVRELARSLGLSMADKPSESCLATRLSPGNPLDRERLGLVERLESLVRSQGVSACRVRLDELKMSIETTRRDLRLLESIRPVIMAAITGPGLPGYLWVERPEEDACVSVT